jgi:hypothetical protein
MTCEPLVRWPVGGRLWNLELLTPLAEEMGQYGNDGEQ